MNRISLGLIAAAFYAGCAQPIFGLSALPKRYCEEARHQGALQILSHDGKRLRQKRCPLSKSFPKDLCILLFYALCSLRGTAAEAVFGTSSALLAIIKGFCVS